MQAALFCMRAYSWLKRLSPLAGFSPLLNIDMLMMNNTGNNAWLRPLQTSTMALQSGLDTFTTQHVSLVLCSDNKGQQLSTRLNRGATFTQCMRHRLGTRLVMLWVSSLCPGWEISALRAMVSHPGVTMWEVKVQTFHREAEGLTQLAVPDVGPLWGLSGLQVVYFGRNIS